MERWEDKWEEVHDQETQKQIARLALAKQYRRYEWWFKFNRQQDDWQDEQDSPGV